MNSSLNKGKQLSMKHWNWSTYGTFFVSRCEESKILYIWINASYYLYEKSWNCVFAHMCIVPYAEVLFLDPPKMYIIHTIKLKPWWKLPFTVTIQERPEFSDWQRWWSFHIYAVLIQGFTPSPLLEITSWIPTDLPNMKGKQGAKCNN